MSVSRRISDLLRAGLIALALASAPGTAPAQSDAAPGATSPVVIVDQERLFDDSLFGQRVLAEIDTRSEELAAENRRIETMLITEERALTEQRRTMPREAFRRRAEEFDARVTKLRSEQVEKLRVVSRMRDDARQEFYGRIGPILQSVLAEREALVLLDRRAVLSAVEAADITDIAIARIDAEIGDGVEETGDASD